MYSNLGNSLLAGHNLNISLADHLAVLEVNDLPQHLLLIQVRCPCTALAASENEGARLALFS
jgi:hypothetical protein